MSALNCARDAIDLVADAIDASVGLVEHASFGEYLGEWQHAGARGRFTEDVVKIAGQ